MDPLPERPEALPESDVSGKAKPKRADRTTALYDDAMESARQLKQKHRRDYQRDPKDFRATVRKAHGRVLRIKPGPKENRRIAVAASERAKGSQWEDLYSKYIDHYDGMPEFTRSLAEAGLQRKVNTYLQHHPTRKRKWQKQTDTASVT